MHPELIVIGLLFIISLVLLLTNFKAGFYVLLILSVLLHKELFSIFRWDILPVRLFMVAFTIFAGIKGLQWFIKEKRIKSVFNHAANPFILFLLALWLVRAISLIFSKNMQSSIQLLGFFTSMVVLGIYLFYYFQSKPQEIIKFIKFYIFVVFGLCVFAFIQLIIYAQTGKIYGALWNVPGHLSRVGSLFWDVNHFGGLLAGLLPVLGIFILVSKGVKERLGYMLLIIPMSLVLLLTNSRTSWISAFIALMVFITLMIVRRVGVKGVVAVVLALILISIPFVIEYQDKSSPFRARVKQYFHYRIDSFDSHLLLLRGAFQVFESYPYIGGGYGSFFEHFSKTKVAAEFFGRDPAALNVRVPAHTIWGELVAETGITGLAVFILFILSGLLPLLYLSQNQKDKKEYLISSAMLAGLVGWLTAGIFYSYNSEFFWLVFFMYFIYGLNILGRDKYGKIISHYTQHNSIGFWLILIISVGLVFFNLGKNHLLPWDEAIYAQIAKNMVQSGDFIVQRWWPDRVWYEKPPLGMWLIAVSFKLFGISEFTARLSSAIFGIGTVLIVYFFGRRMFNKTVGFISALSLLTTFNFLYYSRASMLDVTSTFFITLSLFLYWLAKNNNRNQIMYWVISGLTVGMSIMVKGVVGFIPFAVIGMFEIYLFLIKKQKLNSRLFLGYFSFFIFSVLVFMPWHLEMYRRFGAAFIDNYLGYHVLDRATSSIEDKGRPFFWYTIVMKVSMRIWFVVLIPALLSIMYGIYKKSDKNTFLMIWLVFIFLLFSSATSKLKWYIIPIYPATSLMVGYFLERALDFLFNKVKVLNPVIIKTMFLYSLVVFGLFYLFVNRELVYETDLTGAQALLLEEKDQIFGTDTKVYADRIDLPLILYYSDSPFEVVDFAPLNEKISVLTPEDKFIFITKESRYRKLKESYPRIEKVSGYKEWVMGFISYGYDYDSSTKEVNPIDQPLIPPVDTPIQIQNNP